jgi:hypothetical protein
VLDRELCLPRAIDAEARALLHRWYLEGGVVLAPR